MWAFFKRAWGEDNASPREMSPGTLCTRDMCCADVTGTAVLSASAPLSSCWLWSPSLRLCPYMGLGAAFRSQHVLCGGRQRVLLQAGRVPGVPACSCPWAEASTREARPGTSSPF